MQYLIYLVRYTKFSILIFFISIISLTTGCGGGEEYKKKETSVDVSDMKKDNINSANTQNNKFLKINDDNIDLYTTEKVEDLPLQADKESSSLLVIADDRSGSTSANRKLTKEEYIEIISSFSKSHSGTVAVRVIGNPVSDNLEFHRILISPFYFLMPEKPDLKNKKMTLTRAEYYKKKREKIKEKNYEISIKNKNSIEEFINTVEESVINYKKAGKDLTDVNDALKHITEITNEKSFEGVNKIYVIILSDGIHDATKEKVKLFESSNSISLHLIGWKDKSVFSSLSDVNIYESKEGFLNALDVIFK